MPGVVDPFGALRLYRIAVLRDLLRDTGTRQVVDTDGWAANAQLLLRAAPYARRIETVSLDPRYDLRPRETRIRPFNDALQLYRANRAVRAPLIPGP